MKIPVEVTQLLCDQRLGVLCTSFDHQPHASLMAFTYLPDEQAVLLATRRDTTKSQNIERNPRVSFLVFRSPTRSEAGCSCTLSGAARFIPEDAASQYRKRHQERHPNLPAFTTRDLLTLVRIDVKRISFADAEDRVRVFAE